MEPLGEIIRFRSSLKLTHYFSSTLDLLRSLSSKIEYKKDSIEILRIDVNKNDSVPSVPSKPYLRVQGVNY